MKQRILATPEVYGADAYYSGAGGLVSTMIRLILGLNAGTLPDHKYKAHPIIAVVPGKMMIGFSGGQY